jgi:broad specificity phosphatase PhoE
MGRLVLVRHGQASFSAPDYDQLGPSGERQARRLGEYWAASGLVVDAVETGPRIRHRRTAAVVGEAYAAARGPWPEPVVCASWDEQKMDQVLGDPRLFHRVEAVDPRVTTLRAEFENAATVSERERARTFQRLFEAVTYLWSENAFEAPGIEPWTAFRDDVRKEVARIVEDSRRGRTVAVFTSVGPIAATLGLALGISDRAALELGWRLRNASLTEFVYSPGRLTLDGFNGLPHLPDPALWTYR